MRGYFGISIENVRNVSAAKTVSSQGTGGQVMTTAHRPPGAHRGRGPGGKQISGEDASVAIVHGFRLLHYGIANKASAGLLVPRSAPVCRTATRKCPPRAVSGDASSATLVATK
jgi:hypothetical protein